MATATEMTLALGRTVCGGDQSDEAGSDERIEGHETRLSVTWRLTDEEQDLTLMASVLAEEAERALMQAVRTVRKGPNPEKICDEKSCDIQTAPRLNHEPNPNIKPNPNVNTERFAAEHHPTTGERQSPTGTSPEGTHTGNGNAHATAPGSRSARSQPASSYPPAGQAIPNQNGGKAPAANGPSGHPAYIPPITKTQQLAIQSHCTRHGVADWELRRLLWERFGKKEQRELNKDQAGELLTVLQQDVLGRTAETPAYAN